MSAENPLADKRVRSLVGLLSAGTIGLVAILFLDGPIQLVFLGVAAVDAVMTPYMLGLAADDES
jgi:hypothetical protein